MIDEENEWKKAEDEWQSIESTRKPDDGKICTYTV